MSYRVKLPSKQRHIFQGNNTINFQDKNFFGYVDSLDFENGVSLLKSDIKFEKNCDIKIDSSSKNLIFNFLLDGNSKYSASLYGLNIDTSKDHSSIVIDNNTYGIKKYTKDTHLKSIQLFLNEDYLKNLFLEESMGGDILEKFDKNYDYLECLKHNKIDFKTKINVHEIFNSSFNGNFNKLYIQSKMLDILHIELKELLSPKIIRKQKEIKFSSYDKQALYKAKEILIQNMDNPPSISELSKIIKLNEFKLKVGFKKFFNNTPYGLLFEYKMEKAKRLLEISEYNVNEISLMVGYKHSYNFSDAFFKRFNVRPKELMKNRKYYY